MHTNKSRTNQEFFLLFLSRLVIEATGLDDLVVDVELEAGTSIHRFFNALFGDKAQDANGFRLTDTMGTILSLEIGMRIPITVEAVKKEYNRMSSLIIEHYRKNIHDDCISSLQIQTKTTSSCRQNEGIASPSSSRNLP
jgi:hypothetical protein